MEKLFKKRNTVKGRPDELQSRAGEKPASLPNSFVMRMMQDPAAEKEADRLSQGMTSSNCLTYLVSTGSSVSMT